MTAYVVCFFDPVKFVLSLSVSYSSDSLLDRCGEHVTVVSLCKGLPVI